MPSQRSTPIDDIIVMVALRFGITPEEILGRNRSETIATARLAFYWLARNASQPRPSYPQIGCAMGRDHTTVMSGEFRMGVRIESDAWLRKVVLELRERIVRCEVLERDEAIPTSQFDAAGALEVA